MPCKVRVVTTCMNYRFARNAEENRRLGLALLEGACAQKPDIVCLPETFSTVRVQAPLEEKAEPVPGPTTDACAAYAKQYRTYVICPLLTRREGKFYNSAVILDRQGQVVGTYDKVQPVTSSHDFTVTENGVTPGREATVFDLDFGRIGIQICFDMGFPETWRELADKNARLVFYPSAVDGGFALRAYAYRHRYYVVSAVRSSHARIINPLGEVLEETGRHQAIAAREIDLDYVICHMDFHHGVPDALMRKYGPSIAVRAYEEEGYFLLESNSDSLPVDQLIRQNGLESSAEYYRRHRSAYDALREGRRPEPQQPPYRDRPQWG